MSGHSCWGLAYRVADEVRREVFEALDHREKGGYERHQLPLNFTVSGRKANGIVYVASRDNPEFLGDAPVASIAAQIASSHGPSGSNQDYLIELAQALREWREHDAHVFELESRVRSLLTSR